MAMRSGFTLIELSIVLLVIGLLTSAVLVGRDLIATAQIRKQISQIDQYRLAATTFRTKYGGLPGDLKAEAADAFGMAPRSGQNGHGDGDGSVESCTLGSDYQFGCESALFWTDLSFAGLIPERFTAATDDILHVDYQHVDDYFPKPLLGAYTHFTVFTLGPTLANYALKTCRDRLCLALVAFFETYNHGFPYYVLFTVPDEGGIASADAFAIDSKMDDGQPFTGTVNAGTSDVANLALMKDAGYYDDGLCLTVTGPGTSPADFHYAVSGEAAKMPHCSMNIVLY